MKRVCAWCRQEMGFVEHGACHIETKSVGKERPLDLLVTTVKTGEVVLLRIEEIRASPQL